MSRLILEKTMRTNRPAWETCRTLLEEIRGLRAWAGGTATIVAAHSDAKVGARPTGWLQAVALLIDGLSPLHIEIQQLPSSYSPLLVLWDHEISVRRMKRSMEYLPTQSTSPSHDVRRDRVSGWYATGVPL